MNAEMSAKLRLQPKSPSAYPILSFHPKGGRALPLEISASGPEDGVTGAVLSSMFCLLGTFLPYRSYRQTYFTIRNRISQYAFLTRAQIQIPAAPRGLKSEKILIISRCIFLLSKEACLPEAASEPTDTPRPRTKRNARSHERKCRSKTGARATGSRA